MCKIGDIIVVKEFKGEDNVLITKHSFIVIDDTHNKIKGVDYDFAASIMSSFKDNNHKEKMLSYKVNQEITDKDIEGNFKLKNPSYVKTNKIYLFDKTKIEYRVIAKLTDDYLDNLIKTIVKLDEKNKLSIITTNLAEEKC